MGKPPPEGRPGFNPDLMVLDLARLRESGEGYLGYFSERRVKSLIGNYLFHTEGDIPSLGDMVGRVQTCFRKQNSDIKHYPRQASWVFNS